MNAPVNVLEQQPRADQRLGIIDCDIHPYPKAGAINQYLSERWRKHLAQYGKFNCGPYADRGTYPRFSPNTSRREFLAAGWRAARLRRRLHPRATSRPLQHRLRRPRTPARRQHVAQPRRSRGAVHGDERVAGLRVRRSGTAAARLDPGAAGRSGSRGQGNREARRRLAFRPDPAWVEDVRAARPPPLLADLRRRAGQQSVDRSAYRRHAEQCALRRRLAAILHRGSSRADPLDAEPGGEHDPGRRVRGISQFESRA